MQHVFCDDRDGDTTPGDGCSATCTVECGYKCDDTSVIMDSQMPLTHAQHAAETHIAEALGEMVAQRHDILSETEWSSFP